MSTVRDAQSIGAEIIERIAASEGVDPIDMDMRLYDSIDVDALQSLIDGIAERDGTSEVQVNFSVSEYSVSIDSIDGIAIDIERRD